MSDATAASPVRTRPLVVSALLAVVSGSIVATLLCLGVAAIAHAAGASTQFLALTPAVFTPFVVIGAIGGAVGWAIIARRSAQPRRLLRVLVPVVLLVSLIPDVLVGISKPLPGTSWGAVIALMVMHVVVAACVVTAYRYFMPVRRGSAGR